MVEAAAIAALLRLLPHSVRGGVNGTNYGGTGILCSRRRTSGVRYVSQDSSLNREACCAVGAGPSRLVRGVRKQKIWVGPVIFPLKRKRHFNRVCGAAFVVPKAAPSVRRGIATTWARMASASFTRDCASFRPGQSARPLDNRRGCRPGSGTSGGKEWVLAGGQDGHGSTITRADVDTGASALTFRRPHDRHHPWHPACTRATSTVRGGSATANRRPMESYRRNPP